MLRFLNIIIIAIIVVLAGLIALPLAAAGTPYPCEAVARILVKNAPKSDLSLPMDILADEFAVRIGTAYARSHGISACYRMIPVVLRKGQGSVN